MLYSQEVLQSLDHLRSPSLDSLQFFLYWDTQNCTRYSRVLPSRCWVEGKNHFSWPACSDFPSSAQYGISLLSDKFMLLNHVQLNIYQDFQVLFYQGAFQLCGLQHALVPFQVQSSAVLLTELLEILVSPFLKVLWVASESFSESHTPHNIQPRLSSIEGVSSIFYFSFSFWQSYF